MITATERAADRALDSAITNHDNVVAALLSYGKREIYQTVDDIAARTRPNLSAVQTYQVLYRMAKQGQIEILKESSGGGKEVIVGVKLNFAETSERIRKRVEHRAKERTMDVPRASAVKNIPALNSYMEAKLAVERAKDEVRKAGLDVDLVVTFEINPLGEEALLLLQELIDVRKQLFETTIEAQAAKRDLRWLKEHPGASIPAPEEMEVGEPIAAPAEESND